MVPAGKPSAPQGFKRPIKRDAAFGSYEHSKAASKLYAALVAKVPW